MMTWLLSPTCLRAFSSLSCITAALATVMMATPSKPLRADDPRATRHVEGLEENTPDRFALTHATLQIDPETRIENGTILVRGTQIEAVGEGLAVPPGYREIDLSGRWVFPAAIDPYAPAAIVSDAADNAAYWNPEIRTERRTIVGLRPDASQDAAWRAQGFGARHFVPEDGILRGTGALVTLGDQPIDQRTLVQDTVQAGVLTLARRTADRDAYPTSPMGAVALARQTLLDAAWYHDAQRAAAADPSVPLPEYNRSLEALGPVLEKTRPLMLEAPNELYALRADRFAREFDLSLMIVGSGQEYLRLEAIAQTRRPLILPLDFPKPPDVATPERALDASLSQLMHWDLAPENPARLHAAGLTFAFTPKGLSDPKSLWPSVRKAIERGLPDTAALAAMTTVPAKLLGIEDRLGTLEAGKLASFVVSDALPWSGEAQILETWVSGQRFEITAPERGRAIGRWNLAFDSGLAPATIVLQGKDSDLKGHWELPPLESTAEGGAEAAPQENAEPPKVREVAFQKLALDDWRLAGMISAEVIQAEGVLRLSLVIDPTAPEKATGILIDSTGRSHAILAERVPEPRTAPADESVAPDAAAEAAATEAAASEPAASDAAATVPSEGAALAVEGADAPKDDPRRALYDVNYPLGAYGRFASPQRPTAVLFKDVTVWTCGPQGILERAQVLVVDGRIAAIGETLEVPADAMIIEGAGMHLTPGIIDCHSHMATDGGVNESGQAITSEVRIGDFIDCDDMTIYRQLAGGVTAANILHGSANPIGGQNQVIKLRWGATDEEMKFAEAPAGIKFALGENVKQANWGDRYRTRYPQTRMGVEQIIKNAFLAARQYRDDHHRWQTRREGLPPRRNLELEAILEILEGKRWIHCHSYRQDEILALLRTCEEFQVQIGSLQHILEGYKVADAIAAHGAGASAFSDWWAYKVEVSDAIPYAGAIMHQQGIVVSFNSDDDELARHLNQEAAKAVKYGGVSPEEALKFVTLNPAKQLRIDAYVGSIEVGKHADLVLWSGSPLSNFSRCEQTWIDGCRYFDRTEDLASRAQFEAMRTALIQRVLESGEQPAKPGEGRMDPSQLWPRHDEFCPAHDHTRCRTR